MPIFYNDDTKDTFKFGRLFRAFKKQLEVNADHFAADRVRQAFTEGRAQGKTVDHLIPYMVEGHPNRIKASQDPLSRWEKRFTVSIIHLKAIAEFQRDWYMKKLGDDFIMFNNRIIRPTGLIRKDEKEWKEAFNSRLPATLANQVNRASTEDMPMNRPSTTTLLTPWRYTCSY